MPFNTKEHMTWVRNQRTGDWKQRIRDTHYERHGADFYAKIGAMGGRNGTTGGFYANRALARSAGTLGGTISRRNPNKRLSEREKAVVKRRLSRDKAYQHLLRVHEKAKALREVGLHSNDERVIS